ncbi:MAG: hypothetical protein M1817_005930 [Caeruleum heppii]|nr:MAG: hypothetical protein M1817_005930 [Caeruleum heppii]
MATDMDIDMDIDLQPDPDDRFIPEPESMAEDTQPPNGLQTHSGTNGFGAVPTSESDAAHPTPHKIHLRGLDNLHTTEIQAWTNEHFPSDQPTRTEWIDDTSANIVYTTPAVALKALTSLSYIEDGDAASIPTLQERPGKPLSAHPGVRLHIRLAMLSDRKQPGARERSRYYLFHPDQDPAERKQRGSRSHRDSSQGDDRRSYRRRQYDDREHRQRNRNAEDEGFTVDMYDDNAEARATRATRQDENLSSDCSSMPRHKRVRKRRSRTHLNGGPTKELFPDKLRSTAKSTLRGRSASPSRDTMADDDHLALTSGSRHQAGRLNSEAQLTSEQKLPTSASVTKELFPTRLSPAPGPAGLREGPRKRELFPQKNLSNHRRSGAFDAADETADLFSGKMNVPFMDGASDQRQKSGDLLNRIGRGRQAKTGRLADRISFADADEAPEAQPVGYNILGAAKEKETGFSIRGAATEPSAASAKGDILMRSGGVNAGKELFAERLSGRGVRRRKAEDMFS